MLSNEKKYEFAVKEELSVNLASENMGVKVFGWNENKAVLEIKVESLSANTEEIDFDSVIQVEMNEDSNELVIELNDPEDIKSFKSKVRLYIPVNSKLQAELGNGSLSLENLKGEIVVETENGAVNASQVDGKINFRTENGVLKLQHCNADMILETENGAIKLLQCDGNIKAQTENGAFKSNNCSGSLQAESENGIVRVTAATFTKAFITTENSGVFYEFDHIEDGQFNFQNQNGKLQLILPDEVPYKIVARNKLGRFHLGLDGDYDQHSEDGVKTVEMVKGSGNVKIELKNENGSINLMKLGARSQKVNIDFTSVSKILDQAMEHLPKEVDQEKIRKKMEKAKEKLKNIKLPDMQKINIKVEKALEEVGKEINDLKIDLSIDELKEKAEEKISDIMGSVKEKYGNEELNQKAKQKVDERSRLKILELLQEGRITADEAECLIKAMEGRND